MTPKQSDETFQQRLEASKKRFAEQQKKKEEIKNERQQIIATKETKKNLLAVGYEINLSSDMVQNIKTIFAFGMIKSSNKDKYPFFNIDDFKEFYSCQKIGILFGENANQKKIFFG